MEVSRLYPAMSDITSSASSTSVLVDSRVPSSTAAADSPSLTSISVSDSCVDMTTFGNTRRMVHCLAEHVVHGN